MKNIISKIFKKGESSAKSDGLNSYSSYDQETIEVTDLGSRRQPEAQELKIIRSKINAILYPEAEELVNSDNSSTFDVFEEIIQLEKISNAADATDYQLTNTDDLVDNTFVENAPEESGSMLEAFSEYENSVEEAVEEKSLYDEDFLEVDDQTAEFEEDEENTETDIKTALIEEKPIEEVKEINKDLQSEIDEAIIEEVAAEVIPTVVEPADDFLEISDETVDEELENDISNELTTDHKVTENSGKNDTDSGIMDDMLEINEEIIEDEPDTEIIEEEAEIIQEKTSPLQKQVEEDLDDINKSYMDKRKSFIELSSTDLGNFFKLVDDSLAGYKHNEFNELMKKLSLQAETLNMKYLVNYFKQLEIGTHSFNENKMSSAELLPFMKKEVILSDEDDLLAKINEIAALNRSLGVKKAPVERKSSADFDTDKTMVERVVVKKIDRSKRKVIKKPRQNA
jgi:hypothetical protein